MMEPHLSGYEPLLRRLFHRGFPQGLHSLMILSAPLHPSLIDFGTKFTYSATRGTVFLKIFEKFGPIGLWIPCWNETFFPY